MSRSSIERWHTAAGNFAVVGRSWDASAPGVLCLPSGRLIRGRGLRRQSSEDVTPEFGIYLLGDVPAPVPWDARWVRWPDFRLPVDRHDAHDAPARGVASLRGGTGGDRV